MKYLKFILRHIPLFCGSCGFTRCKSCYSDGNHDVLDLTSESDLQCQCCFNISNTHFLNDSEHKFILNLQLLPNPGVHSECAFCYLVNNDGCIIENDRMMLTCGHSSCISGLKLNHNIDSCSVDSFIGLSATCNICNDQDVRIVNRNLYFKTLKQNHSNLEFMVYDKITFCTDKYFTKILNYDMRRVYNHLIKQGTPSSQAFHGICEYRKFMIMKWSIKDYEGKSTKLSPSPIVDLVWHTHILFTQDYYNFCKKCFKNLAMRKTFYFVHHNPDGEFDSSKFERTMNTILLYMAMFKCDVPNSWFTDEFSNSLLNDNIQNEDVYLIFVKGLDGKTSTFRVTKSLSIFDLKLRIQAKLKVPLLQQRLVFAGCQLEDSYTFGGTKCEPENKLKCVKGCDIDRSYTKISINVRVGPYNTNLTISSQNTINDLIEYITDKTGLKNFSYINALISNQNASFNISHHTKHNNIMDFVTKNGIKLKNGDMISFITKVEESGIEEESTLHLVLRLKGC